MDEGESSLELLFSPPTARAVNVYLTLPRTTSKPSKKATKSLSVAL
jgi:hypothetical protein